MRVKEYLGKQTEKCEMCSDNSYGDKYRIVGELTDAVLRICIKCAKREIGGKRWQQKSQQLKKLQQR